MKNSITSFRARDFYGIYREFKRSMDEANEGKI